MKWKLLRDRMMEPRHGKQVKGCDGLEYQDKEFGY